MTRFLCLVVAYMAGGVSFASWIGGLLPDAGIAGAISAAAVVVWGYLAYRDEQRDRMREYREQVWRRRGLR